MGCGGAGPRDAVYISNRTSSGIGFLGNLRETKDWGASGRVVKIDTTGKGGKDRKMIEKCPKLPIFLGLS
jgi:hypothetical protein